MNRSVLGRCALAVFVLAGCSGGGDEEGNDGPTGMIAQAAASLAIEPLGWNVVGLDSNNVTVGPNEFPVGARITNTGDATAFDVTATWSWTSADTFINIVGPMAITRPSLAPGASADFYFTVRITRNAAAYDNFRRFVVTGSASGGVASVSTPSPREIYVQKLLSQGRNEVISITGPTTLTVGDIATYVLTSGTATQGYEQLITYLTFGTTLFDILSVDAVYDQPPGATNDQCYVDACGLQINPTLPDYLECVGPPFLPGEDKAGGSPITTTYVVRARAPGTVALTAAIDDMSGGSFHYNADFAAVPLNITILANNPPVANDDAYSTLLNTPITVAAPGILGNDTDADSDPLTASGPLAGPSNGVLSLNANGSFTYTPNSGFVGTDTFTYRANDGSNLSNVATVSITVSAVLSPPIAVNDGYSTTRNTPLTVASPGVLANDTDADGDTLIAIPVAGPSNGTLSGPAADGSFTYTPNPGFTGTDTFTYRANDGTFNSNIATVTITVTNDPPVASDDAYTTPRDVALVIPAAGILGNDTDPNGDALTSILDVGPTDGVLALGTDGSFTYTPNLGFIGSDSFTYHADDGVDPSNIATVTIIVIPNDPPVAQDDFYTTDEDTALFVPGPGVLVNDTDPDADPLEAVPLTDPANGTIVMSDAGAFIYVPDPGFLGVDTFTYEAHDGISDSNVATVTITVLPVNDPPVANNDAYSTLHDTPLTVAAAAGVVANDTDPEADPLDAIVVDAPLNGAVSLNADGSFTYIPDAGFIGTDGFTYQVNDGTESSNVALVTIDVTNNAPVAVDDAYSTPEDTDLIVSAAGGALANDTDADADSLTAILVAAPANGSLSLGANGSLIYVPDAGFTGMDSFTYRANDRASSSNVATVTVTVTAVNDPPVADDDAYTTDEDTTLTVAAGAGVLAGDTDANGDPLTAVLVMPPLNGSLTLNADGSFTYTPDADFVGTDSFAYQANDGTDGSNIATVTVDVSAVNEPPVADDDAYSTPEGATLTIAAPGVLDDDDDPDGDPLTAMQVTGTANGSLTLNADGSFTYTPNAGFAGTDSFTYEANDGSDASNTATVTITVTPDDDAPVAADDAYSTVENTVLSVAAANGVLDNDSDPDADAILAILFTEPANGTVSLAADGSLLYIPDPGFAGDDSFTYRANDGDDDSNVATVTVTVTEGGSAPVAEDDAFEAEPGMPLSVAAASGVLQNDTDADADTLSAVLLGGPANGTVSLGADGSFTYMPDAGFTGTDSFTYEANDGVNDSNIATVTLVVDPAATEFAVAGSSCSVSSASGRGNPGALLSGLLLALGSVWLRRRTAPRRFVSYVSALALLACVFGTRSASAQEDVTRNFVVQQFRPAPGTEDILGVESPVTNGTRIWSLSAWGNYSQAPFRLVDPENRSTQLYLLKRQTALDLTGSMGLSKRTELGISVPITVDQTSERAGVIDPLLQSRVGHYGMGDLRLLPKLQLLSRERLRAGGSFVVTAPTGRKDSYLSHQGMTYEPRILAEAALHEGGPRLAGNLGYAFRDERQIGNLRIGNALTYAAAAHLPFRAGEQRFAGLVQIGGEAGMLGDGDRSNNPLEALAGLRWNMRNGLAVTLGGGTGLLDGYGAPKYRVFLAVGRGGERSSPPVVTAEPCPEPLDRDRDGIADAIDACVDVPGRAPTGCPDPDSTTVKAYFAGNRDAVVPEVNQALDALGGDLRGNAPPGNILVKYRSEGGVAAPDPELLQRRVRSTVEHLVASGVDRSRVFIEGGVPEGTRFVRIIELVVVTLPDRDGDGILDGDDACADVPGKAPTGCPDVTSARAYFVANKDAVLPESGASLRGAADAVKAPGPGKILVKVRKEGDGGEAPNPELAQRRVRAVIESLVESGIDRGRIVTEADAGDHRIDREIEVVIAVLPDRDRDTVHDAADACPDVAGNVINGCPVKVILKDDKLLILDKVYFATNKDVILKKSYPILEEVAQTLTDNPQIKRIRVEGHTDSDGSDAANLDLSQRRAKSVMTFLLRKGIHAARLVSEGYGESRPITTNLTVEGKAENRRVEFIILEQTPR